jgi:hypothetical protein
VAVDWRLCGRVAVDMAVVRVCQWSGSGYDGGSGVAGLVVVK